MTDYPDFAPAVTPGPVTFLQSLGPFPAGATWGPVNVTVPSGGSYHAAVFPTTAGQYCCTDVAVGHFDRNNVATWQDFFGGVLLGGGGGGVGASTGATILRGNLYGTLLQFSGNACASAFLNAVLPAGGFTATGLKINVYSTPFSLTDPQPKVTASQANLHSFVSSTPELALAVMNETVIAANTTGGTEPVMPYAGPAVLEITQTGIAAAVNAQLHIQEYTVTNGSGAPWARRRIKGLAAGQYYAFPLNLAPLLRTFQFINADPANAATVDMVLNGGHAA